MPMGTRKPDEKTRIKLLTNGQVTAGRLAQLFLRLPEARRVWFEGDVNNLRVFVQEIGDDEVAGICVASILEDQPIMRMEVCNLTYFENIKKIHKKFCVPTLKKKRKVK